jgi:acetylornithine deacetylase/succinyl-diaminopimelate desuccinylase-like protein
MNRLACVAVLLTAASTSFAADGGATPQVIEQLRGIAEKQYPSLEAFYTTLHREPELSLSEEKTARRLAEQLRSAGFEVTEHVGGFGIVGVLRNGPGKTLLIRTDLDALPVKEQTGAAYHSTVQVTGASGQPVDVMHACGHDIHVTCLSGVARAMAELKDRWKGTLVLIGQPAEEVGKGAAAMLKDGLFTRFPRPDWCLALHVDAEVQAGQVGLRLGLRDGQRRLGRRGHPRHRWARRDASQDQGPRRHRRPDHHGAPDNRQPRDRSAPARSGHRRRDTWRYKTQHHPR